MCCRLFLLVMIFCVCNLYASKIKLKDGTVYSGSIISDKENFLTISVNNSQIRILKDLISEIDGKRFVVQQVENQSGPIPEQVSNTMPSNKKADPPALNPNLTKVILKNGTVFEGTIISENDRIVVLSVDNSPVNIYKNVIDEIKNSQVNQETTAQNPNTSSEVKKEVVNDSLPKKEVNRSVSQRVQFSSLDDEGDSKANSNKLVDSSVNKIADKVSATPIQSNQPVSEKFSVSEKSTKMNSDQKNETISGNSIQKLQTAAKEAKTDTLSAVNKNNTSEKNVTAKKIVTVEGYDQNFDTKAVTDVSKGNQNANIPITPAKNTTAVSPITVNENAAIQTQYPVHKIGKITADTIQKQKADNSGLKTDTLSAVNNNPQNNANKKMMLVESDNDKNSGEKQVPNASSTNQVVNIAVTVPKSIPPISATANATANSKATSDNIPADTIHKKAVKRADGKSEIVLKNGTSFIGKIVSEDERLIQLESDGAIINLLKSLIQSINGDVFVNNQQHPITVLAQQKRDNAQLHTDSTAQKMQIEKELVRIVPKVKIPEGMAIKEVIDSLHSANWERRSQSARFLSAVGQWGTEAIPGLKEQVKDTFMNNSYEPVWIDSSNAFKLLSPGDEAARALAAMGQAGFDALKQLSNDENSFVRRRAAFGFGDILTDQAGIVLQMLLKDPDSRVRAVAITGLRSSKYRDLLISMLKDDDADVKSNTAFMLGKIRDPKACQYLKSLLYDRRAIVRAQAATSLRIIGGTESVNILLEALKDGNLNVRENAVYALGDLKDSSAVLPLITLSKDKSKDVREAILIALSQIRDSRAIPTIYALLKDNDTDVREQAAVALKKHTEVSSLIDALDDESTTVRDNALYMLWLLSGQDIGLDKKLWTEWFSKSSYATRNNKVKM